MLAAAIAPAAQRGADLAPSFADATGRHRAPTASATPRGAAPPDAALMGSASVTLLSADSPPARRAGSRAEAHDRSAPPEPFATAPPDDRSEHLGGQGAGAGGSAAASAPLLVAIVISLFALVPPPGTSRRPPRPDVRRQHAYGPALRRPG